LISKEDCRQAMILFKFVLDFKRIRHMTFCFSRPKFLNGIPDLQYINVYE